MCVGLCSLLAWTWAAAGADLGLTVLSTNRQALVTLHGGTGHWHRVEASTNLLDWRGLTNLCQTNPTSAWLDCAATNFPQRFYRSLQLTPLDVYVATPDTNYSYTVLKTNAGAGQTTFVLELCSQVWLTTNEVNRTLWKHWLIIVKPTGVTNRSPSCLLTAAATPARCPAAAMRR